MSVETIYARTPVPLQHLATSIKGWQFEHKRSDPAKMAAELARLLESERWSTDQFQHYQLSRLVDLVDHVRKNVPFYRRPDWQDALSQPVRSLEDILAWPFTTKQDVRESNEDFRDQNAAPGTFTTGFTSGTTGTPLFLYESKESFATRFAFVARLRSWAGVPRPLKPRRAQFTGRSIVPASQRPSQRVYWRRNIPGNALLFSTVHLTPDTVPDYAAAMRRFRPDLIDGYPSAILILARVATRLGVELPQPKAIITTAETLLPEARSEIEAAFGCRVFDQYAASEPSCFWGECEHGVMHVSPEYGVSEILDDSGNPVAAGEEGEVVVTSFLNPVMPLLRYRVGDRAVRGPDELCACGRQMPRVERVSGRKDDILYVPGRGYVGRLDPAFKGLAHIIEAQIVQTALDAVAVSLVPGTGFDQKLLGKLERNLRDKLGNDVKINISIVDRIPRGANGKFRSVVSEVRHLYPDEL